MLVATVDVTPADLSSVRTAGYSEQLPSPHTVDYKLEANVLGLSGGSLDAPVYVVTIDSLYGGMLGAEIARRLGCARESVVVAGSHTHFAPASDPGLPSLGLTNAHHVSKTAARIVDAILQAPWHQRVRVRVGTSNVSPDMFVNRRRPVLGVGLRMPKVDSVMAAPYAAGPVDRALRLFEVLDESAETLAVGWGAACHPVCSPDPHALSSDFPGLVREALRQANGDIPVLYFQGCSGDVRPASTTRRPPRSLVGLYLYVLAFGRIFAPQARAKFEDWCYSLARTAAQAQGACSSTVEVHPGLRRVSGQTVGDWARTPEIALVNVTRDLALLAVNAEVVSSRISDLLDSDPHKMIIPVTCADEVIGYWPTTAMLKEGGYEGCRSRAHFPQVDWVRDDPDALWKAMLVDVLKDSPLDGHRSNRTHPD